jgi:lysophospholipase L1-like esterase
MKVTKYGIVALAVAIALLYGGCKNTAPSGPIAGLGGATVTKYVSIGNSLTAGYQSNGLFASAQAYSYPNLIAGQLLAAGSNVGTFQQPLYSDPGTPDPVTGKASRYELISWTGPVIGPRGLTPGSPVNTTLPRPYDNLGVPGAVIFDFLDSTNVALKAGPPRSNPLFALVLRSQTAFGNSIFQQAVALHPDLVTFWLGNNDVLGFATSGGVSPSSPTSNAIFTGLYTQALGTLRGALPNAKIVVANIPDVTAIPFFTTLGPQIMAKIPTGVVLQYQKHGTTGVADGTTNFTEANPPLICLTGSPYASLLGQPTGKWYRDHGYPALPAGIDTTKPFGFDPRNPWPDALVLDPSEQATAAASVQAFNAAISSVAATNHAAVVDINGFFNRIKTSGYQTSGISFTAAYVSGGIFSFDGVHPSDQGAGVIANQYILAMNAAFAWSIPLVNVAALPALTVPLSKGAQVYPVIPDGAFSELNMLWGAH